MGQTRDVCIGESSAGKISISFSSSHPILLMCCPYAVQQDKNHSSENK